MTTTTAIIANNSVNLLTSEGEHSDLNDSNTAIHQPGLTEATMIVRKAQAGPRTVSQPHFNKSTLCMSNECWTCPNHCENGSC